MTRASFGPHATKPQVILFLATMLLDLILEPFDSTIGTKEGCLLIRCCCMKRLFLWTFEAQALFH